MKVLIVFAGKNGTTRECVDRLKENLHGSEVSVCNTDQDSLPTLTGFDILAVGSSVRYGALRPSIQKFLTEHEEELLSKPLALFLCCGMTTSFEQYVQTFFSTALQNHAFLTENFGGSLRCKNASLWDKIILYFARKYVENSEIEDGEFTPTLPGILPENISKFADAIRANGAQ